MSDFITGREVKCGIKKASAWRTAVTVGANDGFYILNEGIGAKEPKYIDDDSLGQDDIRCTYKVAEQVVGANLNGYLRYNHWDLLLALALGAAGTPSQVSGTAYSNVYSPASNIDGYFATLAIKKANTTYGIWELPSMKIHGFTIEGAIGELAKVTFNFAANKIETINATNDSTAIGNLTFPTGCNIARMDTRFKIRMNAQAGGALADSDKIYPKKFTLTYNRPISTEEFEASWDDMSEPIQDGFAEASLALNFDKYNLDTFMSAIESETQYKLDILFEGAIITGSTRYQIRIDVPKVQWKRGEATVSGPGKIPHDVTGRLFAVDAAPTGMVGVLDPLSIYVIGTRTTSPLA